MIKLGFNLNAKLFQRIIAGIVMGLISLIIAFTIFLYFYFQSHFLPQTFVSINSEQIELSLLSYEQASNKINQSGLTEDTLELTLTTDQASQSATYSGLIKKISTTETLDHILNNQNFNQQTNYQPIWKLEDAAINETLDNFNQQIRIEGHDPYLELKNNNLVVDAGQIGLELDKEATLNQIKQNLDQNSKITISAVIKQTHQQLTSEEVTQVTDRVNQLLKTSKEFNNQDYPEISVEITPEEFLNWIKIPTGFKEDQIRQFLTQKNEDISRQPQNAVLEIDKSGDHPQVKEFVPPHDGLELDLDQTTQNIVNTLNEWQQNENLSFQLQFHTTQPEITLADTNDLGIKERIGFGDSLYYHSIPNRIHNVSITTDRISNTLVAPGEEFSFNKTLGEVSRRTGYKSAYIISDGKTTLGDGGGVCQVSTTVFRAVLDAGLEVTRRLPHSYRVSYYELNQMPGIDATVYSGNVDLRFVNDTDDYILIHGEAYPEDLYMKMEIYGTSDGRTSEIVDHKTWDYRPAPAPVYYPTTDLPPGKTEQIDWAVAGIKASFTNVIKDKDGNIISQKEYYSNYQPWSAKYLVGE